ncbi:hypothetical protein ACRAR1_06975 [Streptomyces sanyensis]|uniref:hypothetical protein n=1 Tax=Streptomyces sanyensis TaxID=568869 RepID=UPI003D77327B
MYQNATREQIAALLHQGLSNMEISRRLRCDRHRVGDIRRELGLARTPHQPLTLEEKWRSNVREADGGHLEWTGSRQSRSGTPVMRYRQQALTAAAIAFRIKHGRDPIGYAYAECGVRHCVAPDHVDDQEGRTRGREQLRYLSGGRERPAVCRVAGHDQAEHGRLSPDGVSYCHTCHLDRRAEFAARGGPQ